MSDDCGLLIFEVTDGRILPLPPRSGLRRVNIPVHPAIEPSKSRAKLFKLAPSIDSATGMSRLLIFAAGGRNFFFLKNETTRSRSPRRVGEMV
jgi:hypothetical protein